MKLLDRKLSRKKHIPHTTSVQHHTTSVHTESNVNMSVPFRRMMRTTHRTDENAKESTNTFFATCRMAVRGAC